jgi:putative addiction module killer protein
VRIGWHSSGGPYLRATAPPWGQAGRKGQTPCPPLDLLYPIGYNRLVFIVRQTEEFVAWLDELKDKQAQVRIAARLRQAEAGNLGDWQPIEGDVSEMRIDFGPGYRLYFTRRGRIIVVILNAGDKSSQKRDIRRALKLAAELGDDL